MIRPLLLAGLLVLAAALPASAQEASPAPLDSLDVCGLITPDELALVPPGVPYNTAEPGTGSCTYTATADPASFAMLDLSIDEGSIDVMGSILGGERIEIAGLPAHVTELGAYLGLGTRILGITGLAGGVADPVAYFTAVAELVAPRIPAEAYGAPAPDTSAVGPVCPILGGDAVGAAIGVEIALVEGDDVGCTYSSAGMMFSDGYASVNVRYDPGTVSDIPVYFPGTEEVDVDGRSAYWSPDIGVLWVDGGDRVIAVQFLLSDDAVATRDAAAAIARALIAAGG